MLAASITPSDLLKRAASLCPSAKPFSHSPASVVMRSPCAGSRGSALDPPLWIAPNNDLSLSPFLPWTRGRRGGYFSCVVLCLLLQYLLQSCSRGGRGIVEDMCYARRRAEACGGLVCPSAILTSANNSRWLIHNQKICRADTKPPQLQLEATLEKAGKRTNACRAMR